MSQLLRAEIPNLIILTLLYLLQGIPLGLGFGSIPFLLKSKLSYSELGFFSLVGYPYSLKLLWSPIVDSFFLPFLGRRKSWIIPIQTLVGIILYVYGSEIERLIYAEEVDVHLVTGIFFFLTFLSATQDIAVDGWALTLLSKENVGYGSTCQTIGLNAGYFLSFTVFLAFNSSEFCNKYILSVPSDRGLLLLGPYLIFWGLCFLVLSAWLILFKKEEDEHHDAAKDMDFSDAYKYMFGVCTLPNVKKFIMVMLFCKVGFITHESVTGLKLLEKGFNLEYLALTVLIDFPFQIVFGYYVAKWSQPPRPLKPWKVGFYLRIFFSAFGMWVVWIYPEDGNVTTSYLLLVICSSVMNSFASTIQFVSMGSFFNMIADPFIGGTYMTLLNTFSNLGGTWPKYFIFKLVDYYSEAICEFPENQESFSCNSEVSRHLCQEKKGKCTITYDGYYMINTVSIILGLVLFELFIQSTVRFLESASLDTWKLQQKEKKKMPSASTPKEKEKSQ